MVISGDSLWKNYRLIVRYKPEDNRQYSGIAFRYRNDRCFYFFGVKDSMAYISLFNNAENFNSQKETRLVEKYFVHDSGSVLNATVTVRDSLIVADLNDKIKLRVVDGTYRKGKIGLVSNARAEYSS
jgi:hypothetical protein